MFILELLKRWTCVRMPLSRASENETVEMTSISTTPPPPPPTPENRVYYANLPVPNRTCQHLSM